MSEQSMRHTFKKYVDVLKPNAHWQRFEDSLQSGIPDINVCYYGEEYWLEAKLMEVEKLPKKSTTPIRIGLSAEQACWLEERAAAGGRTAVLLKLGRVWYLFSCGFTQLKEGLVMTELVKLANITLVGKMDVHSIFKAMDEYAKEQCLQTRYAGSQR